MHQDLVFGNSTQESRKIERLKSISFFDNIVTKIDTEIQDLFLN